MNCYDLKISPCMECADKKTLYCWVSDYWPNYVVANRYDMENISFLVEKYIHLGSIRYLSPTDQFDRQIYFLKFLELYYPASYDKLSKLLVLA
jgi:hypothetical protein